MHLPLLEIPYPVIDPIIFKLGPIAIRWYGMAYLTGFIIAYFVLIRLARRGEMRMPADWVSDMVGWLALGVVGGGRTGWWLFYHVADKHHPEPWWEPFAIWHGGMSFHGGITGVMIGLAIWCRVKKLSFLNLADCLSLVTPIGLFLGRIANFINGELYGRGPTHVPWAMVFPTDTAVPKIPRHPSQLYEALLEGPVLFAVVWGLKRLRNRRDGQIAAAFIIFYAIFRFCVEFTREPDPQLGYLHIGPINWITMGQVLSIAIGIAGVIWWIALQIKGSKPPEIEPLAATQTQKNTPEKTRKN